MLRNLHISHYALIDELDIEWQGGFSVITGETGAGKSILLGALGLLLGQRADARSIRPGAAKCVVEGRFDLQGLGLHDFFEAADIDFDGNECIVRREVTSAGKSRAFINDTPVPLTRLKELSPHIIDIHSQHQNLLMGHEQFLLQAIDTVAGNAGARSAYDEAFKAFAETAHRLAEFQERAAQERADADFVRFRLQQIDEADLREGEQEELEQESETLGHAEEIKQALYHAAARLSGEETSLPAVLRQAAQALSAVGAVFPVAKTLEERIDSVRIELEDVDDELRRALDKVEFDPERLNYVDERLATIYDLQKKHSAASVTELLEIARQLRDRLDSVENADDRIAALEHQLHAHREALEDRAARLSETRRAAARQMEETLKGMLRHLGMPNVSLHFSLVGREEPGIDGRDAVCLLFSANKNVPEQNVAQIASGGEIARLMLALKTMLAAHRSLPTVVFDEIDTGVSGTMAEKMAEVMRQMGTCCQVICITHLPQIAALGAAHYRVRKEENAEGTVSQVERLSDEERVLEIANMLSGEKLTDAAIGNAKALLRAHER